MAIIIKVGGALVSDQATMTSIITEIGTIIRRGETRNRVILIHGGGKAVTDLAARLGIVSTFRDGVRLTQRDEMAVVDMVLAGLNNTELVRLSHRAGVPAVGLTGADGALLTGRILYPEDGGRTAEVARVNPAVLDSIGSGGYLPILATVGVGEDGGPVNINADEAAQALAREMALSGASASAGGGTGTEDGTGAQTVTLCFIADTAGVLDQNRSLIREIPVSSVERLIAEGTVQGGMAAKLRSCAAAIRAGVHRIVIGGYNQPGDLARLIDGVQGTSVVPGEGPEGDAG